jgi:hypothetical protein
VTAKGTDVERTPDIVTADLLFDEEAADLWEPALAHLPHALAGDTAAFLTSLETSGRGAGLMQSVPVGDLLDAYGRGSELVRARLLASDTGRDAEWAGELLALERAALTRIASGYSDGLTQTIDRLRRVVEESSPVDRDSGAMRAGELGERLSLEVERCRRMDLSLGLLELVTSGLRPGSAVGRRDTGARHIAACLRENLRRYDSVGLTDEGAFVLVLPDISRRGLAGAAERIRRELGACAGKLGAGAPELTFALAHYDYVDVNALEMLALLSRSLSEARAARRPLAWA